MDTDHRRQRHTGLVGLHVFSVAQRKMERIMLGITLKDRIRNTQICHLTGVTDIIHAIKSSKHRWLVTLQVAATTDGPSKRRNGHREIGEDREDDLLRDEMERQTPPTSGPHVDGYGKGQILLEKIQGGVPQK